ncbi:tumor necrosis factor receptor superfamily member 5 [Brachyistius frenatus]|uniref:tumor necrosis factor receptor superfamily member 5 n=1 Tax=Brachyistius frenatus TaxID=100188 RepID=UPI0037E70B71
MSQISCTNEDKYTSKDGRCCDRCPAGTYIKTECGATKPTDCVKCGHGFFTATKNHLLSCHVCKICSSSNNEKKVIDCTDTNNAVCECMSGFYCINNNCDYCQRVAVCPLGKGVKFQATRTNNTVCAPCEEGTFSNVTDFHSPCKAHTRCDDYGRKLKTAGTTTSDVACGNFKSHCHWVLPAGLWSGLVLTILVVVLVLIFRRTKRKWQKAVPSRHPVSLVEMVPARAVTPPDLSSHCQESCTMDECKLSLFKPDDDLVNCSMTDSFDSSHPITPRKVSVSFVEPIHIDRSEGYCTSNLFRSYSEPQEDEWCGT